MPKNILETLDIINLIESFSFLSDGAKSNIKSSIISEILDLDVEKKKYTLETLFKVFKLFGNFATEELFHNGKIVFKGDNEYVYNSIAKNMEDQEEFILFPGCVIAKGDNNSYISLSIPKHKEFKDDSKKQFNFSHLIIDAIKPTAITVTINAENYPSLLKKF